MYVISSFASATAVAPVLADLEQNGIGRDQILAVPLAGKLEGRKDISLLEAAGGINLPDSAFVFGTVGMTFGTIYGYVLEWGPIIWGLIGLAGGVGLGFLLAFIKHRLLAANKKSPGCSRESGDFSEVILMIRCSDNMLGIVEKALWTHHALGVARLFK